MNEDYNTSGSEIGIVNQVIDDENIAFIVNNSIRCKIGDIVAVPDSASIFILAEVFNIEIEYYLDNSRQFFISKAVEDQVTKIGEANNKPRYGQNILAKVLGYYKLDSHGNFSEEKDRINKYTTNVFQKVYSVDFPRLLQVYGLSNNLNFSPKERKFFKLGTLAYPAYYPEVDHYHLDFDFHIFTKHTIITGVTGSGKSRLATIIVKELASLGAHINIFDPHNEYYHFLLDDPRFKTNLIDQNNIRFSDRYITPSTLSKLLPTLSEQQENLLFEMFDNLSQKEQSLQSLIERLVVELLYEFNKGILKESELTKREQEINSIQKISRNHVEYVSYLIGYIKGLLNEVTRASKLSVILAVLNKINDLREKKLVTEREPDWLKNIPSTIDIFSIDYSANDYIRRFINSIIQFLLRQSNQNEFRVLVIDEAHMLLTEDTLTSKLLKQLLREARKFNISVIFISQNLDDIPEDIRGQFQNRLSFRQEGIGSTKYYSDRICKVSLYGSKCDFAMRVADFQVD